MFTLCTASVIAPSVSNVPNSVVQRVVYHAENIKFNFDGTINSLNYTVLLCSTADNDTYTFKEILHQPDAKNFVQAMIVELNVHETRNHWNIM